MSFKKIMALTCTFLVFSSTSVLAKIGTESGGGGDASEARVNEIRSDILKWINNEGAKGLFLPNDISYNEYASKMIEVLQPQKVIIGFTDEKVIFDNAEKTCKSFIENSSAQMHILCNVTRFGTTSDTDQYKLIHHEYAGLVRMEKNNGAASDYNLSSQLTEFLTYEMVLKLAIKKSGSQKSYKNNCSLDTEIENELDIDYQSVVKSFKKKIFIVVPKNEAKYSIQSFTIRCNAGIHGIEDRIVIRDGLTSCVEMNAFLTIKNNVSGEISKLHGKYLSLRLKDNSNYSGQYLTKIKTKKAIADLVSKIAKCD